MINDEFDPREADRPQREDGYTEETMMIVEHIENRGDQRIGQLLLNAVRNVTELEEMPEMDKEPAEMSDEELKESLKKLRKIKRRNTKTIRDKLWNMEAPELLKALEKMEEDKK